MGAGAGAAGFASTLRRHWAYRSMHRALLARGSARPTYFFAAAAEVTGWTKLAGAALASCWTDGTGPDRLSAASMRQLDRLGADLYTRLNLPLFRTLAADQPPGWLAGCHGRSLDQAIIQREQDHVQAWLGALPSAQADQLILEAGQTLVRSRCPAVRKALQRIGRPFSFADQDHREAVGLALADRARAADWR